MGAGGWWVEVAGRAACEQRSETSMPCRGDESCRRSWPAGWWRSGSGTPVAYSSSPRPASSSRSQFAATLLLMARPVGG